MHKSTPTRSRFATTAVAISVALILACGGLGQSPDTPSGGASPPTDARPDPGEHGARTVQGAGFRRDGPRPATQSVNNSNSELATVTNPRSSATLQVYVDLPSGTGPFPAIVMMPGGIAAGENFPKQHEIAAFTARGMAVVRWDPDGRGQSSGDEDAGGLNHQEGLREVIRYAIGRKDIADDKVGVVSYSYGITAATAALAIDNPGAVFLVDWEGPSSRKWTAACDENATVKPGIRKGLQHGACDDESYWRYREASSFAGQLRIPYQRVQTSDDHVHGADWGAAREMIDSALAGAAPWVRLNDAAVNTPTSSLSSSDLPDLAKPDRQVWLADYAEDLFMVARGEIPPTRNHVASGSANTRRPPGQRPGRRGTGRRRGVRQAR